MRLLQSETNFSVFDRYLILQVSIFFFLSYHYVKIFLKNKGVKPNRFCNLGHEFNELNRKARIDPICHCLNIKKKMSF